MRWLKILLSVLIAGYLLVGTLLYVGQNRLIFHPRVLQADYLYDWGEEVKIPVDDGVELSTVWARKPDSKGVVLYFHGNVGDNNRGLYQMRKVMDMPYDAVLVDYRGFGKSGGSPANDEQLLSDMQQVYDRVKVQYPENKIHLLGYSLGSGMAAYLASENSPAQLTLVAPYTSLIDMKNQLFWWVPDALMSYSLDTRSRIADVECPIFIYHGTDDELIPFAMAEELKSLAPDKVRLYPLPGVGHRGAILNMGLVWLQ